MGCQIGLSVGVDEPGSRGQGQEPGKSSRLTPWYYGEFANCVRGRRRKAQQAEATPTVLEPEISSAEAGRNWAWLIQKVYEADPLVCSHCQGRLKVISFIEDAETIKTILEHLGLWLANARPQHKSHSPAHVYNDNAHTQLPHYEEDFSQVLSWDSDL